jgi:hypothetical protein
LKEEERVALPIRAKKMRDKQDVYVRRKIQAEKRTGHMDDAR